MEIPDDLRRRLVAEAWEYVRTKAPLAYPEDLRKVAAVFRDELKRRLADMPVVRIWPDQYLDYSPKGASWDRSSMTRSTISADLR